jgi:hypothetical protein
MPAFAGMTRWSSSRGRDDAGAWLVVMIVVMAGIVMAGIA